LQLIFANENEALGIKKVFKNEAENEEETTWADKQACWTLVKFTAKFFLHWQSFIYKDPCYIVCLDS
jgi:hypothetical protein